MGSARGPLTLVVETELQLLCVQVATHRCALPLDVVAEIHPAVELAVLPDAPDVNAE